VRKERAALNRLTRYLQLVGAIDHTTALEILDVEAITVSGRPRQRPALDEARWQRVKDRAVLPRLLRRPRWRNRPGFARRRRVAACHDIQTDDGWEFDGADDGGIPCGHAADSAPLYVTLKSLKAEGEEPDEASRRARAGDWPRQVLPRKSCQSQSIHPRGGCHRQTSPRTCHSASGAGQRRLRAHVRRRNVRRAAIVTIYGLPR